MKNIDVVNKIIAERNNVQERDVKIANAFYWKTLRNKMVNLESRAIAVRGLCTFPVSKYNLYKEITFVISQIRSLRATEMRKEKVLDQKITRLKALLKMRNEIAKEIYGKRLLEIDSQRS